MIVPFYKSKFLGSVLALTLCGALGATSAMAADLAFTAPGGVISANAPNDPVNLGLVFTANSTFAVNALGFYDGAGVTSSEMVGLYDQSGNLLASATVPVTGATVDGYFFQSITPITLTAGDTYTVNAFVGDNSWSYAATPPNQNADVSYGYHDYLYNGSMAFPTLTAGAAGGGNGSYYGPNFEIGGATTVPEPSSLMFLAIGLLGLGGAVRRRILS